MTMIEKTPRPPAGQIVSDGAAGGAGFDLIFSKIG
jgi:hypothetical protein